MRPAFLFFTLLALPFAGCGGPESAELECDRIGMAFSRIPAGEFTMGSAESDDEQAIDEHPQHKVRITRPFLLSVCEVNQSQWIAVMGTRPWMAREWVKEGPDYPATYVSWEDAVAFCEELSSRDGVTYRLPTEAEWEYACRAETTTAYHFGDDASQLGDYAWWEGSIGDESRAHRVGQKKANAFGLYDMHGNVVEWCSDWYDGGYYARSPVDDPAGPATGSLRVYRGGGWSSTASSCRSADRVGSMPRAGFSLLGFRVVRESADE